MAFSRRGESTDHPGYRLSYWYGSVTSAAHRFAPTEYGRFVHWSWAPEERLWQLHRLRTGKVARGLKRRMYRYVLILALIDFAISVPSSRPELNSWEKVRKESTLEECRTAHHEAASGMDAKSKHDLLSHPPNPEPISNPLVEGILSIAWASIASNLSKLPKFRGQ